MATTSLSSASSRVPAVPRPSLTQRLEQQKIKAKRHMHKQIDTMVDELFGFLTSELGDLVNGQFVRGERITPEHLSRMKQLVKDFAAAKKPGNIVDNMVSDLALPMTKQATTSTVLAVSPTSSNETSEDQTEPARKKAKVIQSMIVDNETYQEQAAAEGISSMLSEDEDRHVDNVQPPKEQQHAPTGGNNVSMNKVNNALQTQNNNNMEIGLLNNDSPRENGRKNYIPPNSSLTQSFAGSVQSLGPGDETSEAESDSDDDVLFLELVKKIPITNRPPPPPPSGPSGKSTITPITVQVNIAQGGTASIGAGSSNSGNQNQDVQMRKQTNMEKKAKLDRHMLETHSMLPYNCVVSECQFAYRTEPELSDHIRNFHPEMLQFSCNFCQMAFSDYHLLYNHEQVAHFLTYRCPVCYFEVADFGPITNPMETVASLPEEGPVECPILGCGKWLKCKRNLKSHFDTHRNFKPYMCTVCNICYNHSSTAKRHIRNVHFNNDQQIDPKEYLVVLDGFMERTPNLSTLEQAASGDNMNPLLSGSSSHSSTPTPRPAVTSNANTSASNSRPSTSKQQSTASNLRFSTSNTNSASNSRPSTPNLHPSTLKQQSTFSKQRFSTSNTNSASNSRPSTPNLHPSTSKQLSSASNLRPSTSKQQSASNLARLPISKQHNSTAYLRPSISNSARPSTSNLIRTSLKPISSTSTGQNQSTSSAHISKVQASALTERSLTLEASKSSISSETSFTNFTFYKCADQKCNLKFLSREQMQQHAEKSHQMTFEKAKTIGDTIPQANPNANASTNSPATANAVISKQNSSNLPGLNTKVTSISKAAAVPSATAVATSVAVSGTPVVVSGTSVAVSDTPVAVSDTPVVVSGTSVVVFTKNDEVAVAKVAVKVESSPVANKIVKIVQPVETAQSNSQTASSSAAAASGVSDENDDESQEETLNEDIKTFSNARTAHIKDSLDIGDADEETDGWQSNREEDVVPAASRKRTTRQSRLASTNVKATVQKDDDETDVENLDFGDGNTRDTPSSKRRRITQNNSSTKPEMTSVDQSENDEVAQNISGVRVISLQCNQTGCSAILDDRRSFYGHLFQVHNLMPFVCPLKGCEVNFENGDGLTEHLRVAHRNVYKWRCKKCSKIFSTCRQLYLHTRALHVEGRFGCAQCEHEGNNRWEVFRHTKDEHGESSNRCTECGRSFGTAEELRSHERSHYLGDREYWCKWPNCTYNSSKKHPLVKHIMSMHFKVRKSNGAPVEGEEANQERRDPNEFIEHIPQILI